MAGAAGTATEAKGDEAIRLALAKSLAPLGMMPRWTAAAFCVGERLARRRKKGSNRLDIPGMVASSIRSAEVVSPPSAATKARTRTVALSRRCPSGARVATAPARLPEMA